MFVIKVKTKLKIKSFKRNAADRYYNFMKWLFKPLAKLEDKIIDRSYKKRCDASTYKIDKLKKLVYKSIQDKLMYDDELFIFDNSVGCIDRDYWGCNYLKVEDLLRKNKYKYLKDYYYHARPKMITYEDWFEIIKEFDGDDVKVEVVDKDEAFKYVKYKEHIPLYIKSNKILKITKCL